MTVKPAAWPPHLAELKATQSYPWPCLRLKCRRQAEFLLPLMRSYARHLVSAGAERQTLDSNCQLIYGQIF